MRRLEPHRPVGAFDGEVRLFHLINLKTGVDAKAQQIDGEFTMLAGPTVVGHWNGVGKADSTMRAYASCREKHYKLIADGSIRIDGAVGALVKDLVFPSLSTAAAITLGRSCNGRTSWIADDNTTFGAGESRDVEQARRDRSSRC